MADAFSVKGLMRIVLGIALDIATLCCLATYTLGPPGIFVGEMFSYIPKILSVIFLGDWNLKSKKGKLKNKKILLKLIPGFGNLPINTFSILSAA